MIRTISCAGFMIAMACVVEPEAEQVPVVRFEHTRARYYPADSIPEPRLALISGGVDIRAHVQGAYCYHHAADAQFEEQKVHVRIVSSVIPGTEDNADCGAFVSGDDFEVRVTGLSTQTYQVMLSWIRPPPATSRILATWDSVLVRGPED